MALNCNQLKSIECNYSLVLSEDKQIEDLLSPLRQFKRLKRLRLRFLTDFETNPYSDSDSDSDQSAQSSWRQSSSRTLDIGYRQSNQSHGSI